MQFTHFMQHEEAINSHLKNVKTEQISKLPKLQINRKGDVCNSLFNLICSTMNKNRISQHERVILTHDLSFRSLNLSTSHSLKNPQHSKWLEVLREVFLLGHLNQCSKNVPGKSIVLFRLQSVLI